MDLDKLDAPFAPSDIEWRVQQAGENKEGKPWCMVLAYVTNRAIMKRLDEVCGKQNWKNEYCAAPDGGVMCGISILIDSRWVTKWDAAENTQIEAVKGGMSGAMKRAAVQWGIGRYLYNLDESFARCSTDKQPGSDWVRAKAKSGNLFYWQIPTLPNWALPSSDSSENNTAKQEPTKQSMTPEQVLEWMKENIPKMDSIEMINASLKKFKAICDDISSVSQVTALAESRMTELEL